MSGTPSLLNLAGAAALCLWVSPVGAQRAADVDTLFDALGLPEVIDIMRTEGVEYGGSLEDEMFPGRGGPAWPAVVERIYDPVMMSDTLREALDRGLEDDELDTLLSFFGSERGERIVRYEVSARGALLDEGVEAAAEDRYREMRAGGDNRLMLIDRFVEVNDLVESNVMGAMNANYAFYAGLADSGAFGNSLSEQEILADVWAQEAEIREETETWVYSYLSMAYQPLEAGDLEAYVALSETDAGRALNAALFAGFDEVFVSISRSLGIAASRMMVGEDI